MLAETTSTETTGAATGFTATEITGAATVGATETVLAETAPTKSTDTPNLDSLIRSRSNVTTHCNRLFGCMLAKLTPSQVSCLDQYLEAFKTRNPTLNCFKLMCELIWVGDLLAIGADSTIEQIQLISQKRYKLRTVMRDIKRIDPQKIFSTIVNFDNTKLVVEYQDMTITTNTRTVCYSMDTIIRDTCTLEKFSADLDALVSIVKVSLLSLINEYDC